MDQYSHDPVSDVADDGTASRQNGRDSLFLMAEMSVPGMVRSVAVRVRNLSSGGLMAEYADGLEQGLPVEFEVRGVGKVPGHVAWSAAGRIGVSFDRPIDPLLARKPVGTGARTPVYIKPILPLR